MKKQLIAAVAAVAMTLSAHAVPITGGISFFGAYTPEDGGGSQPDLALATQIQFGSTVVGLSGTSGSFTVIPDLTSVTMFTPFVFVPPTLPGSALWSVSSGGNTFDFSLSSMVVGAVSGTAPGAQSLTISGIGTIGYPAGALGYTPTLGTFTATFNAGQSTFSWSASTAAGVPDGGATAVLLGSGLLGLAALRSKFLAKAA